MRLIDQTLKDRLLTAQQTLYKNANPWMEVKVLRPETPIIDKALWSESIVEEGVPASTTSVTVRRTGATTDRAFVGYVSGTTLTVKSALLQAVASEMVWEVEEIIPDCTACALEFDGSFVRVAIDMVELLTETLPWLFYLTTGNKIMGGLLGGPYTELVSGAVDGLDAIRGFRSRTGQQDQGLILFYTIGGTVLYNSLIDGEWQVIGEVVDIAPADAVLIHAERTLDWRLVLQVTNTGGALHEVFSTYRDWGWGEEVVPVLDGTILLGFESGNIYRAIEGSMTFELVLQLEANPIRDIARFYDGSWLAATDDHIYKSVDNGDSWAVVADTVGVLSIAILNTSSGEAIAFAGTIQYLSIDWGATWVQQATPGGLRLTWSDCDYYGNLYSYDPDTGYFYESLDHGETWDDIYHFNIGLGHDVMAFTLVNAAGYMYASIQHNQSLAHSEDYGRTWDYSWGGCAGGWFFSQALVPFPGSYYDRVGGYTTDGPVVCSLNVIADAGESLGEEIQAFPGETTMPAIGSYPHWGPLQ